MTYIIPSQEDKKFSQKNDGDLSGNIFVTKNIDFRSKGYVKLSHAVVAFMTTDNDADFDTADGIFTSDGQTYFLSDEVFSRSALGLDTLSSHAGDTNRPTPGVEEDGVFFNDTEVISDGTRIYYQSGSGVWTDISLTLNSGEPTSMTAWSGANTLAVGNDNKVKFVNTSWALNGTVLTLPLEFKVTGISSNGQTLYIATRHEGNGIAQLFVVTTIKTSADASYPIGSFEMFSIRAYGSSIAGVNSRGQLLFFNGGGFDELAHFPAANASNEWADALNDHSKISTKGIVVDGERIYIRYDSTYETGQVRYDNYFPGGVACYDPAVGLHHFTSPSYTRLSQDSIGTGDVDIATDQITVSSAPVTGTPCFYDPVTTPLIGGLSEFVIYYVIKVDATHIKLATSYANAVAGTAIDLTSTGNAFQSLFFFLVKDYGWAYAERRGGIAILTSDLMDNTYGDRVVFTADLFNNGVDKTVGCIQNPFLPNRGYFITPRLNSSGIEDIYDCFLIKHKLLKVDDQIIVKYKTRERLGLPLNLAINNSAHYVGTWLTTTTFTTPRDLTNVAAGDEVEIIAGVGAGTLAHITVTPTYSAGTGLWTVTIDEAFIFATAADTMYFTVDNFKKIAVITSSSVNADKGHFRQAIDEAQDKFIQFKVELRGLDTTIEEFQAGNKTQIPLN